MTAPRPEAVELARTAMRLADCRIVGEEDERTERGLAQRIDAALTAAENKGRSVHGLCCSECGGHMGIGYCLPCVGKKEAAARADERERWAAVERAAKNVTAICPCVCDQMPQGTCCVCVLTAAIRAMEGR